jgi:hypothetical protein
VAKSTWRRAGSETGAPKAKIIFAWTRLDSVGRAEKWMWENGTRKWVRFLGSNVGKNARKNLIFNVMYEFQKWVRLVIFVYNETPNLRRKCDA